MRIMAASRSDPLLLPAWCTLNNVFMGYTPITLEDIAPGVYTVLVRSTGYADRVRECPGKPPGSISTVNAVLAPVAPHRPPHHAHDGPTTVTGPIPTTKASPLDPAIVIGIGCLVLLPPEALTFSQGAGILRPGPAQHTPLGREQNAPCRLIPRISRARKVDHHRCLFSLRFSFLKSPVITL